MSTEQATPWRASVLTLFPEMFPGPLGCSLAGRALERGVWSLDVTDIRTFGLGPHRTVDDLPFGGGAGMVMRPDVVDQAITACNGIGPLVYMSPRGRVLDQAYVRELAAGPGLTVLCGRFEGVDQRVLESRGIQEVSLGDFILSGGELAALSMLDAVIRLLPGVIGAEASLDEESFERGLLEYPHYTRPAEWQGRAVPEVLLSGHHEKIRVWRKSQAEEITGQRRPDLWNGYVGAQDNEG